MTTDEHAMSFHRSQILVDLHMDCLIQQWLAGYDIRRAHEPWFKRQPFVNQADIPRMMEGGYTLAVMGIHAIPHEHPHRWNDVWKQLWKLNQIVDQDERLMLAETAADVELAKREGKLAMMAGLEGAHLLGRDLEHLHVARQMGAVYMTLTHFSKNSAATPQLGWKRDEVSGLTGWGRLLVERLESLNMIADVAHVNEPGLLDVCEMATQPVIASHTTAKGLAPTPRGITDQALRAIAGTGGVIGVMFAPSFLQTARMPSLDNMNWWSRWKAFWGRFDASLQLVADHICYIAERVGAEHVAIGTDFDGWIPSIPNDMRDCRDMPKLSTILLSRGMHEQEVAGILGQNFLRVLRQVRG
jgi:membrane dipeptidase